MKNVITLITIIIILSNQNISGTNLENLISLGGYWKFNIGDDQTWSNPNFDDSKWDEIYAPSSWEDQGYVGYDGYAWYRKAVSIPASPKNSELYINLGKIDDACEIYFNGKRIGQMGVFPPDFVSAYNASVNFFLPKEYINKSGKNVIAVRVYDDYDRGGITEGKLLIGIDPNTKYLSHNLAGDWKLAFRNDSEEEREWHTVHVPSCWESQGFPDYDGYAWYGKSFIMPKELSNETLYLSLGKVDDKDKVYINKKLIGTIDDMTNTPLDAGYKGDWQTRRAYKIPKGVLKPGEKNIIAVLVYDEGGIGGIHEGPVGLMTEENFRRYQEANEEEYYNYGIPALINLIIDIFD